MKPEDDHESCKEADNDVEKQEFFMKQALLMVFILNPCDPRHITDYDHREKRLWKSEKLP